MLMPARFPDRLRLPLDFEPGRLAAAMANFADAACTEHFAVVNHWVGTLFERAALAAEAPV